MNDTLKTFTITTALKTFNVRLIAGSEVTTPFFVDYTYEKNTLEVQTGKQWSRLAVIAPDADAEAIAADALNRIGALYA